MKKEIVALVSGFIFSIGLGISGMTQPQNVIGFLDLQNWNPQLLFVMLGAVLTHAILYRIIRKRNTPMFDSVWHITTKKEINAKLIIGSAVFGIGWGIGGFCPGPAITSLVSFELNVYIFVISMLVGMYVSLKSSGAVK